MVLKLKRVRLFRELQGTYQFSGLSAKMPFDAVTECYIIRAHAY